MDETTTLGGLMIAQPDPLEDNVAQPSWAPRQGYHCLQQGHRGPQQGHSRLRRVSQRVRRRRFHLVPFRICPGQPLGLVASEDSV